MSEEKAEESQEQPVKRKRGRPVGSKTKNKGGRPKGKKDSPEVKRKKKELKILEYAAKQIPAAAIARAVGLPETTTREILYKYSTWLKEINEISTFEKVRGDLISAMEFKVLKSMADDTKHDKASINNLAYSLGQLQNYRRLESGQSTANISTNNKHTYTNIDPDSFKD